MGLGDGVKVERTRPGSRLNTIVLVLLFDSIVLLVFVPEIALFLALVAKIIIMSLQLAAQPSTDSRLALQRISILRLINIDSTAMPAQRYPLQPMTKLALALWGTTLVIWVLRGLAILTFVPGIVLWLLILTGFSLGIVASLQRIR